MSFPVISADSHVTEPPGCYVDHIDPAWRERAPRVRHLEGVGDVFEIEGMKRPVPMGLVRLNSVPTGVILPSTFSAGGNPAVMNRSEPLDDTIRLSRSMIRRAA